MSRLYQAHCSNNACHAFITYSTYGIESYRLNGCVCCKDSCLYRIICPGLKNTSQGLQTWNRNIQGFKMFIPKSIRTRWVNWVSFLLVFLSSLSCYLEITNVVMCHFHLWIQNKDPGYVGFNSSVCWDTLWAVKPGSGDQWGNGVSTITFFFSAGFCISLLVWAIIDSTIISDIFLDRCSEQTDVFGNKYMHWRIVGKIQEY